MKGNHKGLIKNNPRQVFVINCLAKTQRHLNAITSLLKQNTHCAEILLQPEPLLTGKGEPGGEE